MKRTVITTPRPTPILATTLHRLVFPSSSAGRDDKVGDREERRRKYREGRVRETGTVARAPTVPRMMLRSVKLRARRYDTTTRTTVADTKWCEAKREAEGMRDSRDARAAKTGQPSTRMGKREKDGGMRRKEMLKQREKSYEGYGRDHERYGKKYERYERVRECPCRVQTQQTCKATLVPYTRR